VLLEGRGTYEPDAVGAPLGEVFLLADRQRRRGVGPGLELGDDRGLLALLRWQERRHAREARHQARLTAVIGFSGLAALGGTARGDQQGKRQRRRVHYFLLGLQSSPTPRVAPLFGWFMATSAPQSDLAAMALFVSTTYARTQ